MTFPEKRSLNGFLQLPMLAEHQNAFLDRLPKGDQQTPLQSFMRKALETEQPIDEKPS